MKWLILALVAAGPPPTQSQQLGRAECRLTISANEIKLSGLLDVELVIEGPTPVEVEVPRPLTDSPDWRVRAQPPQTTDLPGERQRWRQRYQLEPFQTGDVKLVLRLVRFRTGNEVRDRELAWPEQHIRVTSSVSNADLGAVKPVTDIERLPPIAPPPHSLLLISVGATILVTACGLAAWLLLRKGLKPPAALTPLEKALAELKGMEAAGPAPEQLPHLADVLRRFLEEQLQLAATRQTTAEFQATLRAAGVLSDANVDEASDILAHCDLVKFAAVAPAAEACKDLLSRVRALVTEAAGEGQIVAPAGEETPR